MRKKLDEFAYLASHDLLEPLRKISTLSEFLRIRYKNALDDEGSHYLDMIGASVENMRAIIDSLLTFTSINVNPPQFEYVDLNRVFQSVMQDQDLKITETAAQVSCSSLPNVEGVQTELRLLFNNILSNALKFKNPEGPTVTIDFTELSENSKREHSLPIKKSFYQINVRDNGIGFEQEYADLIFGVFQRLNSKSEYQGFGIGLAVCKKIAERHNGLIFASSKLGGGSTFSLIIPKNQQ
ncbi:MAG TPA: ATP-binding protein [Cyclobacteriaceae bacterium]|nr:ATP-binding protein [Cyclobacteriaceae bacterium]